jgi:pimeloyl-ACP methyl ester carboxylesterase
VKPLLRSLLIAAAVVAALYGASVLVRGLDRPETRLQPVACWFPPPGLRSVECYRFTVPESRGTASNRTVGLPVVILRSPSTPPDEPPVLHLMGGPGQPAGIETGEQVAEWRRLLDREDWARDRDHVLVDPRGVGLASPRLRCAALSDVRLMLALERLKADPAAHDAALRRAVETCRDGFAEAGVDLAAYDTPASAQDLIALRRALRLSRWTVYGISYGARLGLELVRRDAGGTHAAILDSLPPPDVATMAALLPNLARSLELLYADCRADPACARAYPDLRRELERTAATLRARPVTLDLREPAGRRTARLTVDDGIFLQLVEYGLIMSDWLPFLPGIVTDAAHGGTALLGHLAARMLFDGYYDGDANALALSTLCREELPFNPPAAFAEAREKQPLLRGLDVEQAMRAQCAVWPSGTAPAAFRQPVRADVPVLLINGAYDTRTPPAFAERQAALLTGARRIVLRDRGHAPSPSSQCARRAMAAFLDDPRGPSAPPCLSAQVPPRFMIRGGPGELIERI